MCKNTFVHVNYNNVIGKEFHIRNGVRQGGILSSLLFNIYIDEVIQKVSSLEIGCELIHRKLNIFGFADDLIMICPTLTGLQTILNCAGPILNRLCLDINSKSAHIAFSKNKISPMSVTINDKNLKKVDEITYLGIILSYDLSLKNECNRALTSFLRQFNGFYYKFNFASDDVLRYLFRTYCTSFYGISTWIDEKITENKVRRISVGYHKAVKRTANMLPWQSNHEACQKLNVNTFQHLLYKRILSHYFMLIKSNTGIVHSFKYFFRYLSETKAVLSRTFFSIYDVSNIENNCISALYSRIDFVQRNEPRSNYIPIYENDEIESADEEST